MMFKKLVCLSCAAIMTLGACSTASAIDKADYLSQAKYYGVTAADFEQHSDVPFDSEALDGISLPQTKAKVYIEFNEFFPKDILDGVVDAISEGIDYDLHNTQYEMQGLVETYKDFYAAPDTSAKQHTKFFKYEKLGTQQLRAIAPAANTDYIIYAEIMPLYKLSKGKTYDADINDWEYFGNAKYTTSDVKKYIMSRLYNSKQLEINLRLRVFNTKTGLFSFVSTQRLIGRLYKTTETKQISVGRSRNPRTVRNTVWTFRVDETAPLKDKLDNKIHIVLD